MADALSTNPYWWEAAESRRLPVKMACGISGDSYAGLSAALVLASANIHMGFGNSIAAMGLKAALRVCRESGAAREVFAAFFICEKTGCDYPSVGRFTGAARPYHYETQWRQAIRNNTVWAKRPTRS